uniref:Uncharacterized protein n=1 Tax=Cacopsylla melanoneura TaxID=428564 RepID=A0A8D9FHS8_9HEMI
MICRTMWRIMCTGSVVQVGPASKVWPRHSLTKRTMNQFCWISNIFCWKQDRRFRPSLQSWRVNRRSSLTWVQGMSEAVRTVVGWVTVSPRVPSWKLYKQKLRAILEDGTISTQTRRTIRSFVLSIPTNKSKRHDIYLFVSISIMRCLSVHMSHISLDRKPY